MADLLHRKRRMTPFQFIILGFAGVILAGALLLMLPISSKNAMVTPFHEALFTSTSAVCVTGLVVQDTAAYWSVFGQGIILMLIQIGGLGVITVAASFALLSGRKITLLQRSTMQEAICAPKVGGIVRLTAFVIKATFLFEMLGFIAMMPTFIQDFGVKGIWMSFFHSVSAFCNAGFDIMGTEVDKYVSLTPYAANSTINITIMLLIVIGGIGFLTWEDIYTNKYHFKQYRMQSKVILTTTAFLIMLPAVFFFVDFAELPIKERILGSLFQSVTPRTAGFNTTDLTLMSGAGQAILIVLMLIGGSPGSTAGGMKTTTFAVLLSNVIASFRRKEDPQFFGRRIEAKTVKNAATILVMYVSLVFSGAMIISVTEGLPFDTCLFETASAVGTVGLTMGITPQLGVLSRYVLMSLMFLGRVGGLTLIYAALSGSHKNLSKLPQERITVG
ncbi:MAG: Trk family potassium uptake protein [Oscillospiraceae bacterium]|nr:Trk family potassium uptake protein [Oscillospiraceae bacterium]